MCQVLLAGILSTGGDLLSDFLRRAVPPEPVQPRFLRSAKRSGSVVTLRAPSVKSICKHFEGVVLIAGYLRINFLLRVLEANVPALIQQNACLQNLSPFDCGKQTKKLAIVISTIC